MNKEEKALLRQQLRKSKMFRYFVYFPKKNPLNGPVIELQKTKAERDSRLKELKAKRGAKFARGMIERDDDNGPPVFVTMQKAPKDFDKDLKRWARKVPELADYQISTFKESREASDIREEMEEHADEDAAHAIAEEAADDTDIRDALAQKLRKKPAQLQRVNAALDRFTDLAASLDTAEDDLKATRARFKDLRSYAKESFARLDTYIATAADDLRRQPLPDPTDEDERHAYLAARKRLESEQANLQNQVPRLNDAWGRLMAIRSSVKAQLDAALLAESKALDLRGDISSRKSFEAFQLGLVAMEEAIDALPEAVYAFEFAMVDLQRDFGSVTQQPAETLFALPDAPPRPPPEDDATMAQRIHNLVEKLTTDPLFDELAARQELVDKALQATIDDDDDGATSADLRKELARRVLLSSVGAAKLSSKLDGCDSDRKTRKFMQQLLDKGMHSSSEVLHHLRAVRGLYVEITGKFQTTGDYNAQRRTDGLDDLPRPVFARMKAALDFPGEMVGGAFATIADDDGELKLVTLKASSRVIVIGGGPIGLLSALEAASKGMKVTLFEGRANAYTRQNVLVLDTPTKQRMQRFGFYDAYDHPFDAPVKVADMEDGLYELAQKAGITLEKGRAVTGFEQDDNGDLVVTAGGTEERCRLAIVAAGSGVNRPNKHANDVILSDELGIGTKSFALTDNVLSINLDKEQEVARPTRGKSEQSSSDLGAWMVPVDHPTDRYFLLQISSEEFARIQNDQQAMSALVLSKLENNGGFQGVHFEVKGQGRFEVSIQRAESFVADGRSAVLVGDSAGTPHPRAGSGANAGVAQTDAIGDLTRKLAKGGLEGRRDDRLGEGLEDYDARLEEMVTYNTAKGVMVQLQVRRDRLKGPIRFLHERWKAAGQHDDDSHAALARVFDGTTGKWNPTVFGLLSSEPTDPAYAEDQWDTARDLGLALDKAFTDLDTLVQTLVEPEDHGAAVVALNQTIDAVYRDLGLA